MEYITLNNGVEMPIAGYGTYQTPPGITARCVADALSLGYSLIDTAQCYGNEAQVGRGWRQSGLTREEVFITTKLWGCRGYKDTLKSIAGSLKALNMDYIDLLLIHEPTGDVREIYRAMEAAYREGDLRAIGISNFLEEKYLDLVNNSTVVPAVNQVETHVFRQQKPLRNLEYQIGTKHQSWSPLACGRNNIFTNPTLQEIAENHQKTPAQVGLRFLIQQGIGVIPKSTQKDHMKENLQIFDFTLSDQEIESIEALDQNQSLFGWW